jgi:hypothetical protein
MRKLSLFLTLTALPSIFTTLGHAQNYALRFGPQTEAVFPYHPSMNTGATATMEYWVRADSPRGDTTWFRYQGSAEHKSLTVTNNGDIHYLYAGSPWWQGTWYGGVTLPGAGTIAGDGEWHHVAFVRRASGGWSIYRDGVRIVDQGPGSGLGNGCIERFFKTLKEQLLWVRSFVNAEDVRRAVTEWIRLYNEHWLIERQGHRPPAAVRRGLLAQKASA